MLEFINNLTSSHFFLVITGILGGIISWLWKSRNDLQEKNAVTESKNDELVQNIASLQTQAISTITDLKKQDEIDANTPITPDDVDNWLHTSSQPNNYNNTEPNGPNSTSVPLPNPPSNS